MPHSVLPYGVLGSYSTSKVSRAASSRNSLELSRSPDLVHHVIGEMPLRYTSEAGFGQRREALDLPRITFALPTSRNLPTIHGLNPAQGSDGDTGGAVQ